MTAKKEIKYVDPTTTWSGEPRKIQNGPPQLTREQVRQVEIRIKNWGRKNF